MWVMGMGQVTVWVVGLLAWRWVMDSRRGFRRGGSQTHGRGEWVLILVVGVDGAWLMGLTMIGLGWRFVDGLFVGLARFRVWIGVVMDQCCCGRVL